MFVFFPEGGDAVRIGLPPGALPSGRLVELTLGADVAVSDSPDGPSCTVRPTPHGFAVLAEA